MRATVSQRTLQGLKSRIKAAAGDVEQAAKAVSRAPDCIIDRLGYGSVLCTVRERSFACVHFVVLKSLLDLRPPATSQSQADLTDHLSAMELNLHLAEACFHHC